MKLEPGFTLKSDLVSTSYNSFWKDITDMVKDTNPKPVLVLTITYQPGGPEESQLQKMLHACNLTPEQYHIINIDQGQLLAWHKLYELLQPKIAMLIGALPAQLGISALFRLNEPNNFNNCLFIPTLSLKELENLPEVKKQLWNSGLKPVFIDKTIGNF